LLVASPEVQEKFFQSMSVRALQILKNDMADLREISVAEIKEAQAHVLHVVSVLEENGEIVIFRPSDADNGLL
jgi:flagellar motor switch protein FliG